MTSPAQTHSSLFGTPRVDPADGLARRSIATSLTAGTDRDMIFIWRGWGILVVLYALAGLVIGTVVRNAVGGSVRAGVTIGVCEVLAGVAVWFTGVRLNHEADRTLVDPKTGNEVHIRRRHTLFWIPMQYWAPVLAVVGVIVVIAAVAR